MLYRLVALPRGWMDSYEFILEDRVGTLYLFDAGRDHLQRLDPGDANMLMQWYELSQSFSWHSRADLVPMLALRRSSQARVTIGSGSEHRSRSTASASSTLFPELIEDHVVNAGM
jgi:hypothetical protein